MDIILFKRIAFREGSLIILQDMLSYYQLDETFLNCHHYKFNAKVQHHFYPFFLSLRGISASPVLLLFLFHSHLHQHQLWSLSMLASSGFGLTYFAFLYWEEGGCKWKKGWSCCMTRGKREKKEREREPNEDDWFCERAFSLSKGFRGQSA